MARDDGRGNKRPTIVIRKEEVVEGGHHGGAWKVAYADFVTAMMAFFLLMWLLNATTEEQRKGLADYFSPTSVLSHNSSGTGQPFGGHTAFDKGAMVSDRGAALVTVGKTPVPMEAEEDDSDTPATTVTFRKPTPKEKSQRDDEQDAPAPGNGGNAAANPATTAATGPAAAPGAASQPPSAERQEEIARALSDAELRAEQEKREGQRLEQAAQQIREAVRADPALADLTRQLAIDMTPEGLRIQILDEDRSPMFTTGSAAPNERARLLLQKVAPVLMRLSESVSIAGHTDATPYRGTDKSNWELS
ncbi:MAG: flagellar motor protein MotB, partial [Acetobacteraceae bacterium]